MELGRTMYSSYFEKNRVQTDRIFPFSFAILFSTLRKYLSDFHFHDNLSLACRFHYAEEKREKRRQKSID